MCDKMCEIALSCAREHLLPLARDHLLPIIKEAINMIRGVPKEIAELKDELERIEDFISDADRMADVEEDEKGSHRIKAMIKKLIEASFHIEDVIDDYILSEEHQSPDPGCAAAVDLVKTKILRLQIAYKIQNIQSLISEIKSQRGRTLEEVPNLRTEKDHGSQIQSSPDKPSSSSANASLLQNYRDAPFHMDEAGFVGFEEPRDELIDLLIEGRAERTVVSLFGMGGQGKTTLAKKVFDNQKVVKHFDCHVWITVSRPYDIERLLQKMLQAFYKQKGDNPRQMDRKSLVDEVGNYLQEKRYVVVFDDVWDSHFWYDIEFAMIDNKKGSRILITTRNMNVAHACENSSFVKVLQLKPLTEQKSMELFNKKAFYNLDERCPENLIYISSKIVEKCNGLPLAIVVTGGLLSRRDRNTIEWYKFWENINLELEGDYSITRILGLSYHDLPYNLKSCLLYFGLFPEDCEVPSKILTRLWVAEGFVKEEDRRGTFEEVAEGYLKELISRSLVQVVSISVDGRVKSIRVHDLVHGMIVKKCEDLCFGKNITEGKQLSLTGMIRRLFTETVSDNLMEGIENSHVRSLLVCTTKPLSESFVKRIPTKYRRLKVLILEDDTMLEVPTNLGSLSHLKYFGFLGEPENEGTRAIPKSIGMLQNLETLDLSDYEFNVMPKEICKLKKLRHFIGYNMCLIELKDGIGGMTSLQTLRGVDIGDGEGVVKLIQELGKLTQLRELGLTNVMGKYMSVISSSINGMQQMEKLHIKVCDRDNCFMHLNSPPPMLRSLSLSGPFDKLPEWIPKLQNLVKLKFNCSKKTGDVMKLLKSMPSLLSLSVHGSYDDDEKEVQGLHFQDGWFKNLKELYLSHFSNLSYIIIDKGALHSLKELKLFSIPQLKTLPTGIRHLHKLEDLRITSMSEEFMQSISPVEGEEHEIFKQVPSVIIYPPLSNFSGAE